MLSEGYVEQTLKTLGIKVAERKGDELWASCPGHLERKGRKDAHPSWSINTGTGAFYCFSCKMKGNLYGLVLYLSGPEAAEAVRTESGVQPATVEVPADGFKWVPTEQALALFRQGANGPAVLPESELALFTDPPYEAMDERRLLKWAVDAHGVRWNQGMWILPLRRIDGRLMGWQEKDHVGRRFRNHPRGIQLSATLFGFRLAKKEERVVLVESPLDAVMLTGMGYPAIALCGSRISDMQMDLLGEFEEVVLALDADEAGIAETKRLRRSMPWFRYVEAKYIGHGKDFGEMVDADIKATLAVAGFGGD